MSQKASSGVKNYIQHPKCYNEQSISITGASTLPGDEGDRMVKKTEANAAADHERREKIDRNNQADSLVDKQLNEPNLIAFIINHELYRFSFRFPKTNNFCTLPV